MKEYVVYIHIYITQHQLTLTIVTGEVEMTSAHHPFRVALDLDANSFVLAWIQVAEGDVFRGVRSVNCLSTNE